jgi:VanZ family protein
MEHLPLVSWEVFQRLNKLFQFNFYAVFLSFSETSQMARLFSEGYLDFTQKNRRGRFDHLYQYVREIASSLGVNTSLQLSAQTFCSVSTYKNTRANDSIGQLKYQRVIRLPSIVDNTRELNLYGLSERSTACEGILFQMKLLDAVEPLLRAFLPERFHCLLDEAINRSREATKQLRLFVYTSIAGRLIEAHAIPEMISQVNWNMTYLSDRHNDYVVNIVRKCGEVWGALQILGDGSIPLDIREEIWRAILSTVIEAVLLGFSEVKNCTLQGRSVMSMDLHALVNGLELIHHVSGTFSSARAYINNYIKAFFLGNDDLVDWVSQHKVNKLLALLLQSNHRTS